MNSNFKFQIKNSIAFVFLLLPLFLLFSLAGPDGLRRAMASRDFRTGRVANEQIFEAVNKKWLFQNENPDFRVFFGTSKNPGQPEVVYQSKKNSSQKVSFVFAWPQTFQKPVLETEIVDDKFEKPRLIWRGLSPGLDVRYEILKGRGVKEEIVINQNSKIKNQNGEPASFTFKVTLPEEIRPVRQADNSIRFVGAQETYPFYFASPDIKDAK